MTSLFAGVQVSGEPFFDRNAIIAGAEREELARDLRRLYKDGFLVRDLTKRIGRSYGSVHRLLKEAGTEFRAVKGPGRLHDD
nr:helix-turn-helix domain-containing protein [Streptomyces sp. SID5770]